jgi:hypothetical protein
MALRLLPFRQYDEQDVINLFKWDDDAGVNASPNENKSDSGVLVKVKSSDLSKDPVEYLDTHSLLGSSGYPHVAQNGYPSVPLSVERSDGGDGAIGITLNQTLTHDENGENLLRYPQKKAELFAVTSGEAVPVASKGVFTFDQSAVAFAGGSNATGGNGTAVAGASDSDWAVSGGSNAYAVGTTDGKINLTSDGSGSVVGKVLGTGKRTAQTNTDQFAGAAGNSAYYVVVKLDL